MKPEEALQLLDNIVSQVTMSRPQHIQAQQAVQVLQEAIKPKEEKKS